MWHDGDMKLRRRTLIATKVRYGARVAGRCSVCHRPFEIDLNEHSSLDNANQKLAAIFEEHTCEEDMNQPATPKE